MRLIDTHCHLDDESFNADRTVVLAEMRTVGVSDVIIPAITAKSWHGLKHVQQSDTACHSCYGLHPIYLAQHQPEHLKQLRHWLQHNSTVAVGECGLDYYLPDLNLTQQTYYFVEQLKLAQEMDLPVIIHARRSLDDVLKHLRRFKGLTGIVHSFAGSLQQAEILITLGFKLGVGGTCTYERANKLRNVLKTVPLETLVLETDAPDQPDSQWRGKRNTPTRLPVIAQTLADLRQDSVENIAKLTTQTAIELFKL